MLPQIYEFPPEVYTQTKPLESDRFSPSSVHEVPDEVPDEGEYIASSAHSLDSINTIAPSSSHCPDLTQVTQLTQQ